MQNNVTELTQRLLSSLDSNYNVIDMPAVIEIISLLEKVAITKELLQTTRLGKYINELRKRTTNDSLSKRAKELVKKWRNAVLPEPNGQIKQSPPLQQTVILPLNLPFSQEDVNLNQIKVNKRPAKDPVDNTNPKRIKLNGGMSEFDFSDNSNSSFKDVIPTVKTEPKRDVIVINSDSNSSMPEKHDPHLDQQMPKKRGRKKGSKNHRSLIDEAESSFTSKLAVSRGNSKVKTTQELVANLQKNSISSLNSLVKSKEDLNEKAAKLTERVSIIDQQLNTNTTRNKHSQRKSFKLEKNERVIESGSVINDKSLLIQDKKEEDVNVVDAEDEEDEEDEEDDDQEEEEDDDAQKKAKREEKQETDNPNFISALSVEDALAQLPPIDKTVLFEDDEVRCTCILKENKSDFSVEEEAEIDLEHKFEFVEDHNCQAKSELREKYHLDHVTDEMVERLHTTLIPNVNGNSSIGPPTAGPEMHENGLHVNVVPNVNIESIPKDVKDFTGENFSRYSFSETTPCVKKEPDERTEASDNKCFREWHEVVDTTSYQGEILKILPYVIID